MAAATLAATTTFRVMSNSVIPQQQTPPPILRLPLQVRSKIYQHLFRDPTLHIDCPRGHTALSFRRTESSGAAVPSILIVCRQIRAEALPVFARHVVPWFYCDGLIPVEAQLALAKYLCLAERVVLHDHNVVWSGEEWDGEKDGRRQGGVAEIMPCVKEVVMGAQVRWTEQRYRRKRYADLDGYAEGWDELEDGMRWFVREWMYQKMPGIGDGMAVWLEAMLDETVKYGPEKECLQIDDRSMDEVEYLNFPAEVDLLPVRLVLELRGYTVACGACDEKSELMVSALFDLPLHKWQ